MWVSVLEQSHATPGLGKTLELWPKSPEESPTGEVVPVQEPPDILWPEILSSDSQFPAPPPCLPLHDWLAPCMELALARWAAPFGVQGLTPPIPLPVSQP